MSDVQRGQVSTDAAEIYETCFVPALFAPWTDVLLDAAGVRLGHRVVDVGCGTGVLARAARARVGARGSVAAVDPNDGMLAVARRGDPGVDWRAGTAERLDFPDRSFDRTLSQFALMFFADPEAALAEMGRVTRPGGRVGLVVWDGLESNVGYARLVALIEGLFGSDVAGAVRAPFRLGDPEALADLTATALREPAVTRHDGVARFESLERWLDTEIRGWTLADAIDDDGFAALLDAAESHLADLVGGDGVAFDVSALVVTASPR